MSKERWASRLGLVLAMAGNAVGLGNFLRFPAQAAANGGGAFLIPYFVALVVLGLPLMWIEWTMGRYGGQFGHHSAPGVFDSMGKRRLWKYIGVFGLWCNLIIASYYLYIETWTMAYAGNSLIGGFAGARRDDSIVSNFFASLTGQSDNEIVAFSGWGMILFAVCISLNVFILSKGLAKGIEFIAKIGMPLLIVFAGFLAIRGLLLTPGVDPGVVEYPAKGLNFVWEPKFDKLSNPSVWLAAAGQIFFTLSIGMGSIHCYASYLRERDDITLTGAGAAWTNEFCEVILGGTILLPIAVAYLGMDAAQAKSGFSLGFFVFPQLFQNWGWLAAPAGFMWFGLLFFAAITSSLAMGQPLMAFLQTEFGFTRRGSAITFGFMLLPLALPVALTHGNCFFDEFDYWAGTFALVVFATFEVICFAWVFGMENSWREMMKGAELQVPRFFYFVIKYVTPTLLLTILLTYVFEPKQRWDGIVAALNRGESWQWSGDGMIGKLTHADIDGKQAELQDQRAQLEALAALDPETKDLIQEIMSADKLDAPQADEHLQEAERLVPTLQAHAAKLAALQQWDPGTADPLTRLAALLTPATVEAPQVLEVRQQLLKLRKRWGYLKTFKWSPGGAAESMAALDKAYQFQERLRPMHDIDRGVLVAAFAALSLLVFIAWRKRKTEGRLVT